MENSGLNYQRQPLILLFVGILTFMDKFHAQLNWPILDEKVMIVKWS